MSKKDWKRILGYDPDPELKKEILEEVQTEGISIEEAAGRRAMPPIFIQGINEPDPDEYCNQYRPAVYITKRKDN